MSLRIAFDLDGVLADMDTALVRQAETVFGEQITRALEAGATSSTSTSPDTASPDDRPGSPDSQAAPPGTGDNTPPIARLRMDVAVDSKARPILVWRGDERALPAGASRLGIGVVRSVGDCLDILIALDQQQTQQDAGLLARVRKMLGLKTQAGS